MARPRRSRQHRRAREAPASRYTSGAELSGVLFDSDIVIECLRGRRRVVEAAVALGKAGVRSFCTAVQWAEVYAGVRPGEEGATRAFFEARGEVALDGRIGQQAGAYLARYTRSHGLEIADALIAAAATVWGLRLWTLNRRHYPMDDLRFYEPGAQL